MTYIELLNNFWDSTRFNPCTSNEAAMYFYLLHQCNIRRWINPFELKTRDLELTLGISRTTIAALRNSLKQRGFIDFTKGRGSGKAIYKISGVKVSDEALDKKICVQPVDAMLDTTLDTMLNTTLDTTVDTKAKSTLYIEDKRNKTKDNSSVAVATRAAPPSLDPPSLFADEEKKEKKRKAPPKPKPPAFEPPSLDEVKQYFLSQDADKRLENWEDCAQRFFDYFNAVDWIDKNNRRITRWDSRANSWMADDERRQIEKRISNETKQTDRFSERRGTEPEAPSRKGFKGTF